MKLLIITQKIDKNDDVLGFMHGWIVEFAKQCEQVTAIGLFVGEHNLPQNVKVLSLGKENGVSRLKYLWNFYKYIFIEHKNYDAVFVHMNEMYVVLGGIKWKAMGKRVGLWYAHGHVSPMLHLAEHGADVIFTSTKSGFRIPSKKLNVIGQGIDTERFQFRERQWNMGEPFRITMVGRLSPVKDFETLLRATRRLCDAGKDVVIDIVGGAGMEGQGFYLDELKRLSHELEIEERVNFHGAIPNSELPELLARAHCFVNTSRTGSFDKVVGEAMAAGLPVVTSNVAFSEVLMELAPQLMFIAGDDLALAVIIKRIMEMTDSERNALGRTLRGLILTNHGLTQFVQKILLRY